QYVEDAFDTLLTESRKSPDVRPPYTHSVCAKCQRLEHVGTPANSAIDQGRDAPSNGLRHVSDAFSCSAAGLGRSPRMAGHNGSVSAVLDRLCSVFTRLEAFDDDLHLRDVFQPFDEVPR